MVVDGEHDHLCACPPRAAQSSRPRPRPASAPYPARLFAPCAPVTNCPCQSPVLAPQVRFLHEPSAAHGFVGAALSSNVIHFTRASEGEPWSTDVVIEQPWTKASALRALACPPARALLSGLTVARAAL
jgi:hypothetical protein